jgi:hypothetical protein
VSRKPEYLIIDGCPAPYIVAPYIKMVLDGARQAANSIYRGSDAKKLLHHFGKRTQAEIHRDLPSISNPEGESQHDLHSDGGSANPHVPKGGELEPWQVGIDSGSDSDHDKSAVVHSAAALGLHVWHPYKRGVEGHHWCFLRKPRARSPKMFVRVIRIRRQLLKGTPNV